MKYVWIPIGMESILQLNSDKTPSRCDLYALSYFIYGTHLLKYRSNNNIKNYLKTIFEVSCVQRIIFIMNNDYYYNTYRFCIESYMGNNDHMVYGSSLTCFFLRFVQYITYNGKGGYYDLNIRYKNRLSDRRLHTIISLLFVDLK